MKNNIDNENEYEKVLNLQEQLNKDLDTVSNMAEAIDPQDRSIYVMRSISEPSNLHELKTTFNKLIADVNKISSSPQFEVRNLFSGAPINPDTGTYFGVHPTGDAPFYEGE